MTDRTVLTKPRLTVHWTVDEKQKRSDARRRLGHAKSTSCHRWALCRKKLHALADMRLKSTDTTINIQARRSAQNVSVLLTKQAILYLVLVRCDAGACLECCSGRPRLAVSEQTNEE